MLFAEEEEVRSQQATWAACIEEIRRARRLLHSWR
jgi:hypothetical protein